MGGAGAGKTCSGRVGISGVARRRVEPTIRVALLGRPSFRAASPRASWCRTGADVGIARAIGACASRVRPDVGVAPTRTGRLAASATRVHGALLGRAAGACRRLGPPCRRAGSGACTRARVPDGAVLESACAWMERWSAGCGALRSGTARFSSSVDRLGRSRRFGARVTADRRPFLGKSGSGVVGHPQDRRTRGPARALLGRASRAPTGLGRAVRASA